MATTSDDGFHEIQLNGKQLVFLFMAVTVVSVVIFLCGVLVGRGVTAARGGAEASPLEAADLEVPPSDVAAVTPGPGGAPATASEDLTYYDRLEGRAPVGEQLREEAVPPASPAPRTDAPAPAPESAPVAAPREASPMAVDSAPAPAPATEPAVQGEPAGPGFVIQVAALRDRNEADTIARRLADRGYPAYVIAPAAGTPAVFRVRVGKFPERREAEAVAARLEKEEQFKPWITR